MRLVVLIASVWLLLLGASPTLASANNDIVVVANLGGKTLQLSKSQIRSLFMGGSIGYHLHVINLPPSSLNRVKFNTKVIGLTEDRIQSYWAQMRFSGRRTPPKELADEKSVLHYIINTPGSVGYLPANIQIPNSLSIVYQTKGSAPVAPGG